MVAESALAGVDEPLTVDGGDVEPVDFDVRDFGDYVVVVGAPSSAVRGALRLTHMEAGDDPHGDGIVWYPKEAPDA